MSADESLAMSEEDRAEFDVAVICGLTRRFGPYPQEVAAMPTWRRTSGASSATAGSKPDVTPPA